MKKLKKAFILAIVLGMFAAAQVNAFEISNNNEEIPLRLKIGMITEAEFPEKIANVTKSVSSEMLQIETLENRIFFLPKENLDSQVYVVTQDNVSYCVHLIMDGIHAPTRIKIKKPNPAVSLSQDKETANTVGLMKALLTWRQPPGAASVKMYSKEIFNDGKLRIAIDEVYEFPNNVKAFILTFENLTRKPLVVPIEHIELPGLLAISVDTQILEARPRDIKKKASGYTVKAYMITEGLSQ